MWVQGILCDVISTHAPRTGSDIIKRKLMLKNYDFNPRSPHGERQKLPVIPTSNYTISTHAPRTGSDALAKASKHIRYYFNPRSPHGERRKTQTAIQGVN